MSARAPVIYLHIGAMKTGTTYLQQLMEANAEYLADAGYLYPGMRSAEQHAATRDVLALTRRDPAMKARVKGRWDTLARQMLAHDGSASIFSMEFLSFASRQRAARVVRSLAGAEVHVLLTVRDAVTVLPAQWQTACRSGGKASWSAFVGGARRGARLHGTPLDGPASRVLTGEGGFLFNRSQGIPRMLDAWAASVPPERFHVVTVPPPGTDPAVLWRRFAGVVGVDPEVCRAAPGYSNPSLGQPSADVLRRINARIGRVPRSLYQTTLTRIAREVLAARAPMEPRPRLDHRTRDFALAWNARVRSAINRFGVELVGCLDDLPIRASLDAPEPADRLTEPTEQQLLAAAATARDGLVDVVQRRGRRLHRRTGSEPSLGGVDTSAVPTEPGRWTSRRPVHRAVDELADLTRAALDLQVRLDRAAGRR